MNSKTYDFLKDCALIYICAVGILYLALADIWGLPYGTEVMATCTALSTFVGTVIKLDNKKYNNNQVKEFTLADAERLREEQPELFEEEGEN